MLVCLSWDRRSPIANSTQLTPAIQIGFFLRHLNFELNSNTLLNFLKILKNAADRLLPTLTMASTYIRSDWQRWANIAYLPFTVQDFFRTELPWRLICSEFVIQTTFSTAIPKKNRFQDVLAFSSTKRSSLSAVDLLMINNAQVNYRSMTQKILVYTRVYRKTSLILQSSIPILQSTYRTYFKMREKSSEYFSAPVRASRSPCQIWKSFPHEPSASRSYIIAKERCERFSSVQVYSYM